MSTQDRDSRLMDYLYDEMDPSTRSEFEQRLRDDAQLRAELDSLKSVRTLLQRAENESAPIPLMNDLMRQARLAATTEPETSAWQRLLAALTTPSLAAATMVITLIAVGAFYSIDDGKNDTDTLPDGYNLAVLEPTVPDDGDSMHPTKVAEVPASSVPVERDTPPALQATRGESSARLAEKAGTQDEPAIGAIGQSTPPPAAAKKAAKRAQAIASTGLVRSKAGRKTAKNTISKPQVENMGSSHSLGQAQQVKLARRGRTQPLKSSTSSSVEPRQLDTEPTAAMAVASEPEPAAHTKPIRAFQERKTYGAPQNETAEAELLSKPAAVVKEHISPRKKGGALGKGAPKSAYRARKSPARPDTISGLKTKGMRSSRSSGTQGLSAQAVQIQQQSSKGTVERQLTEYRTLGIQQFGQRRFDLALKNLERYVRGQGRARVSPRVKENLAESYRRTNQTRSAMREYKRILKEHPTYKNRAAILVEVAILHAKLGQLEEAKRLLETAVQDKSVAKRARTKLGLIRAQLQARTKAKKSRQPNSSSKKSRGEPVKETRPQKQSDDATGK